ncbi:MAG: hypothetical protein GAK35_02391 [Herbaspirillum frisingense]|uniref:Tail fiber assembly protein n=1 Tax=Herbaspirillum frisingense TaxID=92645 RepID=A0A7V8JTU4_9BURK|nr:MAG: hypothetical protein GAK35_02391 [Herbaspirillum frisingense]
MQIYNYHPTTHALIGTGLADEDPLNKGEWLVPACATAVAPPEIPAGQRAVFDIEVQAWALQDIPAVQSEPTPATGDSSPEDLADAVQDKRDQLLEIAALRIAPLQDAVDLDMATEDDKAQLILWKQYRVALNRVTQQADYPDAVAWPLAPDQQIPSPETPE